MGKKINLSKSSSCSFCKMNKINSEFCKKNIKIASGLWQFGKCNEFEFERIKKTDIVKPNNLINGKKYRLIGIRAGDEAHPIFDRIGFWDGEKRIFTVYSNGPVHGIDFEIDICELTVISKA